MVLHIWNTNSLELLMLLVIFSLLIESLCADTRISFERQFKPFLAVEVNSNATTTRISMNRSSFIVPCSKALAISFRRMD